MMYSTTVGAFREEGLLNSFKVSGASGVNQIGMNFFSSTQCPAHVHLEHSPICSSTNLSTCNSHISQFQTL